MALALYRRYRPDTFDKVIGQDQVTIPLMRALDEGRLTHAYLFSGPRGCGKTSSARIMARCINCEQGPTSHPCGTCDSCRDLSATGGGSIDVMEIDAASHNGVEDARQLRDSVLNPPVRDRYKIIILDEAHMVTPQGFNALLKTVEEPPERVMFIFATTEPEKVIGTIRSRTHHYPFRLVPPEIMGPYLEQVCAKEHVEPEAGVLKLAMRAGGGSVRDTLSVLDQLMTGAVDGRITYDSATALLGFTPDTMIGEAIDAVIDRDGAKLYDVVEKVAIGGYEPRRFVEDLLARVRDLLVLSLAGQKAESVLSDTAEAEDMDDLKRQAKALGLAKLNQMAEKINTALSTMAGAISPRMRLELLAASLLTENTPTMPPAQSATAPADGVPTGAPTSQASPRMGFIGSKRRAAAQQATPAQPAQAPASAFAVGQPAGQPVGRSSASTAPAAGQAHPNAMPQQPQTPTPAPAQQAPAAPATDWATNPEPAAAASVSATPRQGETTSHGNAPGATMPAQPATSHTAATPDTRSAQERWQAVLALLSEQARQYVDATKVPHVAVNEAPDRSAGKVTLTFDTALSQHAFALAVDGSNGKLPKVVLETVRKVFGARYKIAPSGIAANGEQVEPVTKMPPERQQEIRRQIALAAAKQLTAQIPGVTGFGKQPSVAHDGAGASAHREPQSSTGENASRDSQDDNGDDEEGVRHGGGPAHPALTVTLPDDIDPWEHPEVIPRNGGGSASNGGPGDSGMGSVAVTGDGQPQEPGRAMGMTDGRGFPGSGISNQGHADPIANQPSQTGEVWSMDGNTNPSAAWDVVSPDAGADAWAPAEPSNPSGDGASALNQAAATPPATLPAATDPDSAWGAPGMTSPQSVPPDMDFRPPMAEAVPTPAPSVAPAVDIDDESAYSMDDDSINDGQVDLDTIKKMFDVKQMEVIAPDSE